jgi:hypothetical protein
LAGLSLAALGVSALFAGCKGNTTAAATVERRVGKPPVVVARDSGVDVREADPLTSEVWKQAAWWEMTAPANSSQTTPRTRGATLFDGGTMYVAVVCGMPEIGESVKGDAVTVFVDPAGEGRELLQLTVDAQGTARSAWIRSNAAIEPLEDGSPNVGYPLDVRPNVKVGGLWTRVRKGNLEGREVWSVVMAVPAGGMPGVMQVPPAAGGHWKFNVLRTMVRVAPGGEREEQVQGNLSPVYVGAQAFCPYRMAELDFVGG